VHELRVENERLRAALEFMEKRAFRKEEEIELHDLATAGFVLAHQALGTDNARLRGEIERLREALALIASGGTKYDSAAELIRIAMAALEKP
jgi:hypothetical protein